ncbi:MAG: hypothetical protein F6K42_21410 [Leptolyngbya sp. SIO1D8]|nr:hypothetical protein [Leptolyngbya sp. SIO1D8]
MKTNDWFLGFMVGVLVILVEVGYWAYHTGMYEKVSLWVEQLTESPIASQY